MTPRPPLDGLMVLDFSQYVAGPFATMLLSDLGADVIKVERPGGDAYRHYDPAAETLSPYFAALNRGKRSVVCDLATPDGRRFAEALLRRADAIVHNLRPPQAHRLGLDTASVRSLNPRAVVCAISAFGTEGPDAALPGYDLIAQATSGLLALATRPGQQVPERLGGIPLADFTTGLYAVAAVLSGLLAREQGDGDDGGAFTVSLLGACLSLQAQQLTGAGTDAAGGTGRLDADLLEELANDRAAAAALEPYYRCYETADAYLALACLDVAQRRRLLAELALEDPFADNPQRPPADAGEEQRRHSLVRAMEDAFRRETTAAWLQRLRRVAVPAAEVRTLAQAAASEQVLANDLVRTLHQPGIGPTTFLGALVRRDGHPLARERPAPRLGEDQADVEARVSEPPSPAPRGRDA